MPLMRAKLNVHSIERYPSQVSLVLTAVARNDGYLADGFDENNTYAKFTPFAELRITIRNPALLDSFTEGQEFYVDFTPVNGEAIVPPAADEPQTAIDHHCLAGKKIVIVCDNDEPEPVLDEAASD